MVSSLILFVFAKKLTRLVRIQQIFGQFEKLKHDILSVTEIKHDDGRSELLIQMVRNIWLPGNKTDKPEVSAPTFWRSLIGPGDDEAAAGSVHEEGRRGSTEQERSDRKVDSNQIPRPCILHKLLHRKRPGAMLTWKKTLVPHQVRRHKPLGCRKKCSLDPLLPIPRCKQQDYRTL